MAANMVHVSALIALKMLLIAYEPLIVPLVALLMVPNVHDVPL